MSLTSQTYALKGTSDCRAGCRSVRHHYAFHRWPGWRRGDVVHYQKLTRTMEAWYFLYAGDRRTDETIHNTGSDIWVDRVTMAPTATPFGSGGWHTYKQPGPTIEDWEPGWTMGLRPTVGASGTGVTLINETPVGSGHGPRQIIQPFFDANSTDGILPVLSEPGGWFCSGDPRNSPAEPVPQYIVPQAGARKIHQANLEEYRYIIYSGYQPHGSGFLVVGYGFERLEWSEPFYATDMGDLLLEMLASAPEHRFSGVGCGPDIFTVRNYVAAQDDTGAVPTFLTVDFYENPLFGSIGSGQDLAQAFQYFMPGATVPSMPLDTEPDGGPVGFALSFGWTFLNRDAGLLLKHDVVMPSYAVRSRFRHEAPFVLRRATPWNEKPYSADASLALADARFFPMRWGPFPVLEGAVAPGPTVRRDASNPTQIPVADTVYKFINKGLVPRWSGHEEYVVGDIVIHNTVLYVCIAAHNSNDDNQPPAVNLWSTNLQAGGWIITVPGRELLVLPVGNEPHFVALWPEDTAHSTDLILESNYQRDDGYYYPFYGAGGVGAESVS